jgi:hypothetical protein
MDDDFDDLEDETVDPDDALPLAEPWDEGADDEPAEEEESEDEEDD